MRNDRSRLIALLVAIALLITAPLALADVIWAGTGIGRGLRQEVNVLGVEGGDLVYLLNGNRSSTPLDRIQQISLDGETSFNDAEQAFAAGEWQKAAQTYERVADRHPKDWVRRRAAERLVVSADAGGLFDQAVVGYVQLTLLDPAAAVGKEPALGEQLAPDQLERAVAQVQSALEGRLEPRQEKPLLTFLLNLRNRQGDPAAAGAVVERLVPLVGSDPGADPKLFAQVLLGRANLALNRGDTIEAGRLIEGNRSIFTEPRQQSQALMTLARVAERQAGDDPQKLMDAALEYMKVVTFFKRSPEVTEVPEALLKVGQIHEKLRKPDAAAALYREIVEQYPESAAATEAQQRLDASTAS